MPCRYCGRLIDNVGSLAHHEKCCKSNSDRGDNARSFSEPCKYCGKIINNKGSLASHEMCCKGNPDGVIHARSPLSGQQKGVPSWNKGLTKETSESIRRGAEKSSLTLSGRVGHAHTDKAKLRLREVALERGLGGYQEKSGRGKKGRYKGIWCDSSWELAFVLFCLGRNMNIRRCTERRLYTFDGSEKVYLPDFVVDGEIVEVKGYRTAQWEAKELCNPDVKVYGKEEMAMILRWVVDTYGKDFITLYEEAQAD
jgi:hypothetical protein